MDARALGAQTTIVRQRHQPTLVAVYCGLLWGRMWKKKRRRWRRRRRRWRRRRRTGRTAVGHAWARLGMLAPAQTAATGVMRKRHDTTLMTQNNVRCVKS
jgi:hypothetical protein